MLLNSEDSKNDIAVLVLCWMYSEVVLDDIVTSFDELPRGPKYLGCMNNPVDEMNLRYQVRKRIMVG
jgi:hypothetical protein